MRVDFGNLSRTKICLYSDKVQAECEHCLTNGIEDAPVADIDDYEITKIFEATYRSTCVLNPDHPIKTKDRISFVQHANNPNLPVRGAACKLCTMEMPRAHR